MADAVEASWKNMEQEAADELVGEQRHDLRSISLVAPVVLIAECDPVIAEADEPPVRDRDPVGVAREIAQNGLGSSEWRLGVNHPALLFDR